MKNQESKHTPLPWKNTDTLFAWVDDLGQPVGRCVITDSNGLEIRSQDEARSNAAFIVKACNSYEEMLKMIEILYGVYNSQTVLSTENAQLIESFLKSGK